MFAACTCFAQPNQEAVSKTVDRYNYAVVRYLLRNGSAKQQVFDNNFYAFSKKYGGSDTTYSRIRKSIPTDQYKTTQLSAEIENIKSRQNNIANLSRFASDIVYKLFNEKQRDNSYQFKYPFLNAFYIAENTSNYRQFQTFKETLYQKLQKGIADDSETSVTSYRAYEGLPNERSSDTWVSNNLMGILFVFLLTFIVILWLMRGKIRRELGVVNDLEEGYNNILVAISGVSSKQEQQQKLAAQNGKRLRMLEEKEAVYMQENVQLKSRIDTIEKAMLHLSEKLQSSSSKIQESTEKRNGGKEPPTDKTQVVFFPGPDRDTARFDVKMGSYQALKFSIYQFTLDNNDSKKATFCLIPGLNVENRVLQFPDLYLQHVCDAKGTFGINKRIRMLKPGIATRENDYWIIKEKLVICYE